MNEFVSAYPAVVIGLLTLMVSIIGVLLGALFWSFRQSIDNLASSLKSAIVEIKKDRKSDQVLIGKLLDRMQAAETRCSEHRTLCPALIDHMPPRPTLKR